MLVINAMMLQKICVVQCCDGAKNMCGIKNGVGDMVKNVRGLKDSMSSKYKISNLI